jgi:hypothetical protein
MGLAPERCGLVSIEEYFFHMNRPNNLECLYLVGLFSLVKFYRVRQLANPRGEHLKNLARLAFLAFNRLGLQE